MEEKNILVLAKSLMLEIKDAEIEKINKSLESFLKQVEQINLINTDGVKPLNYPFETAISQMRDDIAGDVLTVDEVLKNAAESKKDMVKIPKVVLWLIMLN